MFLNNLPTSVMASLCRYLVGGNLDEALAVRVGFPVSRRENLEVVYRLYTIVVFVVVDLAEDLVLDDFVFVGFYNFVCDSCIASVIVNQQPFLPATERTWCPLDILVFINRVP